MVAGFVLWWWWVRCCNGDGVSRFRVRFWAMAFLFWFGLLVLGKVFLVLSILVCIINNEWRHLILTNSFLFLLFTIGLSANITNTNIKRLLLANMNSFTTTLWSSIPHANIAIISVRFWLIYVFLIVNQTIIL